MGNIIDIDSDIFPGTNKLKITQYTGIYFKDIIGQHYVKKQLNECINFMNNQQEFKKYEYKMPRGILFVGPPGTGKTMMAKALATEAAVNFISVTASDFENAYYGSGPKNIRNLFKTAKRNTPCIVYIDELDSISSRSNFISHDKSDLINTLLAELDGFEQYTNVLVIAATNNPDKIDAAVLRSGRFDKEIVFDLPNAAERKEYLESINKKFFDKNFLDNYDNNITTLTRYTTGLSLADLSNIINCAKSRFLERISVTESVIPTTTIDTTTITTMDMTNDNTNNQKENHENIKKVIIDGVEEELENHDNLSNSSTHFVKQISEQHLLQTEIYDNFSEKLITKNSTIRFLPESKKFTKKSFLKYSNYIGLPKKLFSQVYEFMKTHNIEDYNFILNTLYKFSLENSNVKEKIEYFDLQTLMFECKNSSYNNNYSYEIEKTQKKKQQGFLNKFNNIKLEENNNITKLGVIAHGSCLGLKLHVKDIKGKNYDLNNQIIISCLLKRYLAQLDVHKRNAIASYVNNSNDIYISLWQLQEICKRYSNHTIKFVQNDNFTDGITFNDINESLDILIVGMAKKERLMSAEEKLVVAYHEVGHALMGYLVSGGEIPIKISIIPSGRNALGYTKHDAKDKHIVSFEDYISQIYCLLGGRCCELVVFNKLYSGASDDLSKIDKILDTMICEYNMFSSFGYIKKINGEYQVSDKVKHRIENFKVKLIKMYSKIVMEYLNEFIEDVHKLAKLLVEKEELTESDLTEENLSQSCITNKGKLDVSTKYINLLKA